MTKEEKDLREWDAIDRTIRECAAAIVEAMGHHGDREG